MKTAAIAIEVELAGNARRLRMQAAVEQHRQRIKREERQKHQEERAKRKVFRFSISSRRLTKTNRPAVAGRTSRRQAARSHEGSCPSG